MDLLLVIKNIGLEL